MASSTSPTHNPKISAEVSLVAGPRKKVRCALNDMAVLSSSSSCAPSPIVLSNRYGPG